jgi:hypothetical protein
MKLFKFFDKKIKSSISPKKILGKMEKCIVRFLFDLSILTVRDFIVEPACSKV